MVERAGGKRVVVAGISMGAAIALRYALRYREALAGLVLASYPPAGDAFSPSWALELADALDRDGAEAAGERYVWGGGRFDAESAKWIRQGFLEHRPQALVGGLLRRVLARRAARERTKRFFARAERPDVAARGMSATLRPSHRRASWQSSCRAQIGSRFRRRPRAEPRETSIIQ